MGRNQNDPRNKADKYSGLIIVSTLLLVSILLSSCQAVAEIFKAGMGFGIFIVLAVFVVIAFFILRLLKK